MNNDSNRRLSQALASLLVAATLAYAALACVLRAGTLAASWPGVLLLALPAATAARLAARRGSPRTTRLALTFVLASLFVLPEPGGLLVALAAALAGSGGGVAGAHRRGVTPLASLLVAAAIAQFFAASLGWPADPASPQSLVRLLLLCVILQGFAFALTLALDLELGETLLGPDGPSWRTALAEWINIPLAWLLAILFGTGFFAAGLFLTLLVLAGLLALLRLDRAASALHTSNVALAARVAELDTLSAIGREIVSSMDPHRVFTILERECRKIFDIDSCFIALTERETERLRAVYHRRRAERAERAETVIEHGLAQRVVHARRGELVRDLHAAGARSPFAGALIDPESRAAMAVPLLVEDRVIGVLCVQSARASAYDAHHLAVLTTIAQQAAVAIENARHYHMATVDSLTGFLMRDSFFLRLDAEYRRARRYGSGFALLMVDLDGFKTINDRNGHLAGDQYLREVSQTIRAQLRGADLACRYGGDEFCLLLPETELAGAQAIAERIRDAVASRVVGLDGVPLRTTVSIGIAAVPDHDAADLEALMRKADAALYDAKRAGRDRVVPFAA